MSCGVSRRCGSDLVLLWLWHRLAATAPIGPLAWEPPYAVGAAQENAKRRPKKKKKKRPFNESQYLALLPYLSVFVFAFFFFSRAAPTAYGGSQARGLIRAVASGLRQSHSNTRSESSLRSIPAHSTAGSLTY